MVHIAFYILQGLAMAIVMITPVFERPWHIWNIVSIGGGHLLLKEDVPSRGSPALGETISWSKFLVQNAYARACPGVSNRAPFACRMLDLAEAVEITEQTDPNSLYLMWDISRTVPRIDLWDPGGFHLQNRALSPYNRNRTVCFYWRMILIVVSVYQLLPTSADETCRLPIILMDGTGFIQDNVVTIRSSCCYEEFLGVLGELLIKTGKCPWRIFSNNMGDGDVCCRCNFRLFLFPNAMTAPDFDVLCAIHAGPNSDIDQVLHELRWNDWFNDVPISHILYWNIPYGIMVCPISPSHWTFDYGSAPYLQMMAGHSIEVGMPRVLLPLMEVPKYLATDYQRSMEVYESEHNFGSWLIEHSGVLMERKRVLWERNPADLSPDDYMAMKAVAKEITAFALQSSTFKQ